MTEEEEEEEEEEEKAWKAIGVSREAVIAMRKIRPTELMIDWWLKEKLNKN